MSAGMPDRRGKVLVMELAGLGDNIHLLPALWEIRQAWPAAELHVMVNAHVARLFQLTPWVDRVWAYPSAPRPGFRENLRWGAALRREGYDRVINTNGSDRSSLLTWLTRAPQRIGRRPKDGGPLGWRLLYTQVMSSPFLTQPMYVQKLACLADASIGVAPPAGAPEFHVRIDPGLRRTAGIIAMDDGGYFHLSPFTTADARELPGHQFAALVAELRARFPAHRHVVSCADNARERGKMAVLLPLLAEKPWKVCIGTLDIPALASVVQGSALSFSGDTGSLHVALMAGTPAVAWFRAHAGQDEWIPRLPRYHVVIAEGGAPDALHGIRTEDLVDGAAGLLSSPSHA